MKVTLDKAGIQPKRKSSKLMYGTHIWLGCFKYFQYKSKVISGFCQNEVSQQPAVCHWFPLLTALQEGDHPTPYVLRKHFFRRLNKAT